MILNKGHLRIYKTNCFDLLEMGYTHYFPANQEFTLDEWMRLLTAFQKIWNYCNSKGIYLRFESDSNADPQLDNDVIRFNGESGDGYETFFLERQVNATETFRFCKTARNSYDLAVCLVLLAAHEIAPNALAISSDGDWDEDWLEARETYKEIFGKDAKCCFFAEEAEDNSEE